MEGPVVWWVRNDLRLHDNPVVRMAAGVALCDKRPFQPVFVFDPRFLDRSLYGRVTDPNFSKSITSRKPVPFSSRKTGTLRARFWLQCVRALGKELEKHGSSLLVCYGKPEDVLGSLPRETEVKCQMEPVSIEQTDVEQFVEAALLRGGSKLRRDHGAMNLYHPHDLPFGHKERPECYSALAKKLGWKSIWTSSEQIEGAAPIRPIVPCPSVFAEPPKDLKLHGLIPPEVLADETKTLLLLGYSEQEIAEAQALQVPQGGEPAARALLQEWMQTEDERAGRVGELEPSKLVYWDLPCAGQSGPSAGYDPLQWANLATSHGWLRVSHYMAVGCISAREIFHTTKEMQCCTGVVHRLMWREFHRLYAMKHHRRIAWLQGPARVQRPWSQDPDVADAWKKGKTGVPYIDAIQRELVQTGWIAYKGRKTSAFFLVHDLGMDWRIGAFHDEEHLMDYDFAMNYGNWAVCAKIGNPDSIAQHGELDKDHYDLKQKLRAEQVNDPSGAYIRRWVPELKNVADEHIHTPWLMSVEQMELSGCVVGRDYPASLVGALDLTEQPTWPKTGGRWVWEEANPRPCTA